MIQIKDKERKRDKDRDKGMPQKVFFSSPATKRGEGGL